MVQAIWENLKVLNDDDRFLHFVGQNFIGQGFIPWIGSAPLSAQVASPHRVPGAFHPGKIHPAKNRGRRAEGAASANKLRGNPTVAMLGWGAARRYRLRKSASRCLSAAAPGKSPTASLARARLM